MISLARVYQLMREAVIYYPKVDGRPKTFAVIKHLTDIDASNLNMNFEDYDKGFFYSEQWGASGLNTSNIIWSYPLVAVDLFSGTVQDLRTKSPKIMNSISVKVLDVISEFRSAADMRSPSEIEMDCSKILLYITKYLANVILAEVDGEQEYYNEEYLVRTNTEYVKKGEPQLLPVSKEPFYFSPYDTGIDKTYGVELRLEMPTGICLDQAFVFTDIIPTRKLNCCG